MRETISNIQFQSSSLQITIRVWVDEILKKHLYRKSRGAAKFVFQSCLMGLQKKRNGTWIRSFKKFKSYRPTIEKITIAMDGDMIIGWSCVAHHPAMPKRVMTYVLTKYRRHGIGLLITKKAKGVYRRIRLPPQFKNKL